MQRALRTTLLLVTASLTVSLAALPARAELPTADALLTEFGFSASDVADVKAGKMVSSAPAPSNERELVAGFAFFVAAKPAELARQLEDNLLSSVDPNVIAVATMAEEGGAADFAKLTLAPNGASRAKRYAGAKGGDDLNLSTAEIAAFGALATADTTAVEKQLRASLLARVASYRSAGLAGIASYDRGGGKSRDVAADLRSATQASKAFAKYAPAFYRTALDYPASKAPGLRETLRWMHFQAHDVPTIALVHAMWVPDGDAVVVLQRQFYVSEAFNCEQAVAAFLPVDTGTVVVYGNRTSTDQVTGFGGSAKRAIGSKLLASQLQALFQKVQAKTAK